MRVYTCAVDGALQRRREMLWLGLAAARRDVVAARKASAHKQSKLCAVRDAQVHDACSCTELVIDVAHKSQVELSSIAMLDNLSIRPPSVAYAWWRASQGRVAVCLYHAG